jgi:hypothetical protein
MRLAASIALLPLLVACSGTVSTEGSTTSSSTLQGTFACGDTTCDLATQLCGEQSGYGPNFTAYICVDLPAPCLTDHTCACVQNNGGAATLGAFIGCTEDSDGAITVTADLP